MAVLWSELMSRVRPRKGLFYGWWLVGLSGLVMALGIVPVFQGMTVWFVALERQFGWRRAQVAFAFSLTRAEGSITGPVGGYLIDKVGSRRMVLIGLLVLGGGFIFFSQVDNLWQFYLAFMIMSVGMSLGTWLPMMTMLNSWFVRRRSFAMAVATEGQLLGGVLLVPVLAWSADPDGDRIGWRASAAIWGVVIVLLAFPISRLVRNKPEDYGLHPDGRPPAIIPGSSMQTMSSAQDEVDYTWQEALRTRAFWLISMGHACTSIVIITMSVHLGPMLNIDRGLSLQTVGWVVSTYLATAAVFTLVGGYMGDRLSKRMVLFSFSVVQSVAVVVLLMVHSTPMAILFGVLLGIGFGGRMPLTTSIRGTYFGRRSYASITGVSMLPMNLLAFTIPLFAGHMADVTGSYNIPFITVAVLSSIGAVMFLMLEQPKQAPARSRASGAGGS